MRLIDEFRAIEFPVHARTRDEGVTITLLDSGLVLFDSPNSGREAEVVARCDPDSEAFQDFAVFWGVRFPAEARRSPGVTRLIYELRTGGLVQDPYFPMLFQDRRNPEALEDGALVWPMFHLTILGALERFNPGHYLPQQCLTLAEDPRIKLFVRIEDCEGHDFVTGAHVACMHKRQGLPFFPYECGRITSEAIKACVDGAPEVMIRLNDESEDPDMPF